MPLSKFKTVAGNYGAASEPLLPRVARCIPVLSSSYTGKCASRVLKCSGFYHDPLRLSLSSLVI